jgi:hypothetical protein
MMVPSSVALVQQGPLAFGISIAPLIMNLRKRPCARPRRPGFYVNKEVHQMKVRCEKSVP